MTVTYSWKIKELKIRNEGEFSNTVVQTYWTKTGTDENGNIGNFEGATPFTSISNTANSSTFIPFSELTEPVVIGWIENIVKNNPSYDDHINERIQSQIDELVKPIVNAALPWEPVVNTNTATSNTAAI